MIIKNMEELGRAIDAGEDLQWCKHDEWQDYQFDYLSFGDLRGQVAEARIRIKPKTVTLYEYRRKDKDVKWIDGPLEFATVYKFTGRKIVNGVVTEEGQV